MMSNKIDINFVVSLIEKNPNFFKEVLREEYLEKINIPKESSTADYFGYWDENNDKSWITFELTDDKIDSLDPTRLALIIVSAYELGRLRIKIRKTSLVTFNELFLKDTYRKLSSKLVNFFDGDKRVLGQLSEHLSNSGMHLMQKGTVNRDDLENLDIGMFFAKEK
jgi:hypothetical protein